MVLPSKDKQIVIILLEAGGIMKLLKKKQISAVSGRILPQKVKFLGKKKYNFI